MGWGTPNRYFFISSTTTKPGYGCSASPVSASSRERRPTDAIKAAPSVSDPSNALPTVPVFPTRHPSRTPKLRDRAHLRLRLTRCRVRLIKVESHDRLVQTN